MTNTTISTDGLKCIHVIDFWDTESWTEKPAYLKIGDRLHLIDYIDARGRGDDQMDIGIVDDPYLHSVNKYATVIYIDDMPQKGDYDAPRDTVT